MRSRERYVPAKKATRRELAEMKRRRRPLLSKLVLTRPFPEALCAIAEAYSFGHQTERPATQYRAGDPSRRTAPPH
jgi:hypothetical protein